MKKCIFRTFLLLVSIMMLLTAASATKEDLYDYAPIATPAEGYYLVSQTERLWIAEEEKLIESEKWEYAYQFNTNGQVTRRTDTLVMDEVDAEFSYVIIHNYTYNIAGLLITEEATTNDSYKVTYTYSYDSANRLTKKETHYSSEASDWVPLTKYHYNSSGQIIKAEVNDYITTDYVYGSNGRYLQCNATSKSESGEKYRFIYDYDSVGNNIKTSIYTKNPESEEYVLWYVLENAYKKLPDHGAGSVDDATSSPFIDVQNPSSWYYKPVLWAVSNNITTGMTETAFMPDNNCTRAQAVTFLWRAAGKPEPKGTANPFTDVKDTANTNWYFKAVLWAYEKGITTGTDAIHFDPDGSVTRGQMVTFLWRMETKPSAAGNTFSDVPPSEYYYNAVLWATSNNITNGMGNNKFEPNTTCTRGHIVTFLYRDFVAK